MLFQLYPPLVVWGVAVDWAAREAWRTGDPSVASMSSDRWFHCWLCGGGPAVAAAKDMKKYSPTCVEQATTVAASTINNTEADLPYYGAPLVSGLPVQTGFPPHSLHRYQTFWFGLSRIHQPTIWGWTKPPSTPRACSHPGLPVPTSSVSI